MLIDAAGDCPHDGLDWTCPRCVERVAATLAAVRTQAVTDNHRKLAARVIEGYEIATPIFELLRTITSNPAAALFACVAAAELVRLNDDSDYDGETPVVALTLAAVIFHDAIKLVDLTHLVGAVSKGPPS